jgi:ABC-2 type transport system permease protein
MSATTTDALRPVGTLGVGVRRVVVELKNTWRNREAFAFVVAFPVMMVLLFASIFRGIVGDTGVKSSQVYVASIIGSALMSTGFTGVAVGIAVERDAGMLRRLAGTPMPRAAYFLGKIGMVVVTVAIQVVVLIALGVAFFDVSLPSSASKWATFAWVFVLGTAASTLLGIAVGGALRNAQSAVAIVNLPFVALQFISGVWISTTDLPSWMIKVSQVLPLHWICRGMRAVFLANGFRVVETGGTWQLGTAALVLGAWCVAGFAVCVRTFRWTR